MNTESVSTTVIDVSNSTPEAIMNTESVSTTVIDVSNSIPEAIIEEKAKITTTSFVNNATADIDLEYESDSKVYNNFDDLFEFEDDIDIVDLYKYDPAHSKLSNKMRKKSAVSTILACGDVLAQEYKDYEKDFVARGNKVLYGLLTKVYQYALDIDASNSTFKEEVLNGMRKHLKDKDGVKTTVNTPWLTTVVKYIVKADRQTASNYSRVLRIAHMSNITAQGLTAFIEERGGIGRIHASDAEVAKRNDDKVENKKRLELMRKVFWIKARKSEYQLGYSGELTRFPKLPYSDYAAETAEVQYEQVGEFTVFITAHNLENNKYHVIYACDFDKNFENVLLNYIGKRHLAGTDILESYVNYQTKLFRETETKRYAAEKAAKEAAMKDSAFDDDAPIQVEATFSNAIVTTYNEYDEIVAANNESNVVANTEVTAVNIAMDGELVVINDSNVTAANEELANLSKAA
jgi:hypothetical protein